MITQTASRIQNSQAAERAQAISMQPVATLYAPRPIMEVWCGVPVFVWGNEAEWEAVQPADAA